MTTTMDPSKPFLLYPSTQQAKEILKGIVYLHAHCILHDHTLATFLPPLSGQKMHQWWLQLLELTKTGERQIIVQLMPLESRTAQTPKVVYAEESPSPVPTPQIELDGIDYEVAGVVTLVEPVTQTGPMRGIVEKLFTSPNHRRKGIARTMMRELERVAVEHGRWNLMLDTTVGSEAENVYPRLGYEKIGYVKDYGLSPLDGRLVDEVWFGKDLRSSPPI